MLLHTDTLTAPHAQALALGNVGVESYRDGLTVNDCACGDIATAGRNQHRLARFGRTKGNRHFNSESADPVIFLDGNLHNNL